MRLACSLAALCLGVGACGGTAASPAPSGGTSAPATNQTCRTYATSATDVETNNNAVPPFRLTNTYTNAFNTATRQLTTTGTVTSSTGCSGPFTIVATWPSVAAFIAEVSVVPPLSRRSHVERSTSACDPKGAIQDFTYDAQNRLLVATGLFNYSAWDSFGRPTAGSTTSAAGTVTVTITYDNTARTLVQTTKLGSNPPASVTMTFDSNGNVTGITEPLGGTNVVTTIGATGTVCQ